MTHRTLADLVGESARPTGEPLPALKRYNVVAHFPDGERARSAILELERVGIDARHLGYVPTMHADRGVPRPPGPSPVAADPSRTAARAVRAGVIAGAVVGAAVFALGYLALADDAGPAGAVAAAAAGAVAVGCLGALIGASSRAPARPGHEATAVDARFGPAVVGVHTDDAREAKQAVGHCAGASAVDVVDADGHPAW